MTAKHPLYDAAELYEALPEKLNEVVGFTRAALGVLAAADDASLPLLKNAAELTVQLGNDLETALNLAARCRHWADAITQQGPPEHPAGPEGL